MLVIFLLLLTHLAKHPYPVCIRFLLNPTEYFVFKRDMNHEFVTLLELFKQTSVDTLTSPQRQWLEDRISESPTTFSWQATSD